MTREWTPAPIEALAALYAPKRLRLAYTAFFLLDRQLSENAMAQREPALRQLRLAWWRDALGNLDAVGPASHPVLVAAKTHLPSARKTLEGLVDGWEEMSVGKDALSGALAVAAARADVLAAFAQDHQDLRNATIRWTCVELAGIGESIAVRPHLLEAVRAVGRPRLPRALRPLTMLDGLARRALERGDGPLLGDRLSPLVAIRLGIFGR